MKVRGEVNQTLDTSYSYLIFILIKFLLYKINIFSRFKKKIRIQKNKIQTLININIHLINTF